METIKLTEDISETMEKMRDLEREHQGEFTITKDDLSCLIAATIEVVDGLAENDYALTWNSIYDKYGDASTFEGRALASQRFFERNFNVTGGALHLTQCVLHLLWRDWDRLIVSPQTKKEE